MAIPSRWPEALRKLLAWLALGLLLPAVYAVAGFHGVPVLIRTVLLPAASRALGAELRAERVEFDPFAFALAVHGFSLKDSAGQELAAFRELSAGLDAGPSLALGRPVLAATLAAPVLRPALDERGRLNFAALFPANDGEGGGVPPFLVTRFAVREGRVEFRDASGGRPWTVVFDGLTLDLENLDARPGHEAGYRLAATGGDGETLAAAGTLTLSPPASAGTLEAAKLNPALWLDRLAPDAPWRFRAGTLSAKVGYAFQADGAARFQIRSGTARGENLELADRAEGGPWLTLRSATADGFSYSPAQRRLRLEAATLAEFESAWGKAAGLEARGLVFDPAGRVLALDSVTAREAETPHATAGEVAAQGGSLDLAGRTVKLRSAVLRRVGSPSGTVAEAAAEGLSFDLAKQTLRLDAAEVRRAEAPFGTVAAASAKGLALALPERRLALDSASVRDVATDTARLAALSVERLSFDGAAQRLDLGRATANKAVVPTWFEVGAASAGAVSYNLAEQRLQAAVITVQEAVALGPLGPVDGPPPAAPVSPEAGPASDGKAAGAGPRPDNYPPRRARIGNLQVAGLDGSLSARTVAIDSVVSERAEADLRRLPGDLLRVRGLPAALPVGGHGGASSGPPWRVDIAGLRLEDYALGFRDDTVDPPVRLNFGPAQLRMSDFSTRHRALFTFYLKSGVGESGTVEVDGQARLEPLQVDLRFGVDQLWLRALQPYWQDYLACYLQRGKLNLWGDITVRRDKGLRVDYSGAADIVDLEAQDWKKREPLLRWDSLKFDGLVVHGRPKRFAVRTLTARQPYARVVIGADGGLNLSRDLLRLAGGASSRPPPGPSERWPVLIGLLRAEGGQVDFADLTLRPGFMTTIQDLNGNISGLSSQDNARARLLLEGRINRLTPVKIYGQVNPFSYQHHTDVTLDIRGLNLATLSAYAGKFAGYRIEKGKIDMNLRYRLENSRLEVDNRLVLDQLNLGERVDRSKATTLPVDLAIALLKDSEGRIDVDLPISGRLDDPSFSLRGLYANALVQFFRKLTTSPFALVGSLVRGGDESLAFVKFPPGQKSLPPEAVDKLGKLARALNARPGLALNIKGAADSERDRRALAEQALLRQLKAARKLELRTEGQRVRDADALELTDTDYRRLFTALYRQRHPDAPELRELVEMQAPMLDGAALDAARRKLVEAWPVSEMELRLLAQARSDSIRDYLVRVGGLPDRRIYLLDVRLEQPGEQNIGAFLSLSGA